MTDDHHHHHRQQQPHEGSEPPVTPPPLVHDVTPEKKKKSKKEKKRKDRDRQLQRRTPSSSPVLAASTGNFAEAQDTEQRNAEEDFGGTNILISVPTGVPHMKITNFIDFFHRCGIL